TSQNSGGTGAGNRSLDGSRSVTIECDRNWGRLRTQRHQAGGNAGDECNSYRFHVLLPSAINTAFPFMRDIKQEPCQLFFCSLYQQVVYQEGSVERGVCKDFRHRRAPASLSVAFSRRSST